MSANDQLSRVAPYVGRLLGDEYVQDQLGQAIAGLRRSSSRAKGKSAGEMVKDQKLRHQLRAAVASLVSAGQAVKEPPPKRRVGRGAVAAAAATTLGVAALVWQRRSAGQT